MRGFACILLVFVTLASASAAEVRTASDGKGHITKIIGLADGADCHPFEFEGAIVKRDFADDALTLTGIVIEAKDGTREFFNIEIPKDLNMALKGNVYAALQQLTRMGRKVSGRAFACGAAGRVEMLDALR